MIGDAGKGFKPHTRRRHTHRHTGTDKRAHRHVTVDKFRRKRRLGSSARAWPGLRPQEKPPGKPPSVPGRTSKVVLMSTEERLRSTSGRCPTRVTFTCARALSRVG